MADDSGAGVGRKRVSLSKQATNSGIAAELLTLLETVTADGSITEQEIAGLQTWLDDNAVSDLPGIDFLRTTVTLILADGEVTSDEKTALYKAVERVLPPEARRQAKERRTAVEALDKERSRTGKAKVQAAERAARTLSRPLASANFMVAGVLYEGRAGVVSRYASEGDTVFLVRDPNNAYDCNAVRVRLRNGRDIGFVPREYAAQLAPVFDSGCKQRAYLTKVLSGRRAPIPVVQAYLYRPDAEIAGAVSGGEIPTRTTTPIATEAQGSACAGWIVGVLAFGGVVFLSLILKAC